MFQKLYKNLEEINSHSHALRESLSQTEHWAEKVSGQLESIDRSLAAQKPFRLPRMLVITHILILFLGAVVIAALAWRSIDLSRALNVALTRSAETSRESAAVFTRYQALEPRVDTMLVGTARLDSLIQEQAKAIRELQKLDEITVRAFIRLKRDLDRQHANWPAAAHIQ